MDFDKIQNSLNEAIRKVIAKDILLFEYDINEPSITHRLAMYLAPMFKDYDVDCEYNGNVDADTGRKYINILKDQALALGIKGKRDDGLDLIERRVYPDIIVHRRGKNGADNNLLVIEVKKSTNLDDPRWDAEKLARFTSPEYDNRFEYSIGAFVYFDLGPPIDYRIDWYRQGQVFLPMEE